MSERNRFEEALFIQGGACNGRAIAKALVKAYEEAHLERQGTDKTNADPAVQLIVHQLCHLAQINTDDGERHRSNPAIFCWDRAYQECIDRCGSPATIELLGLTHRVSKPADVTPT